MTSDYKRRYIKAVAEKPLTRWLPDIGAMRCLRILEFGTDKEIEQVWNHVFKVAYEVNEQHGTHPLL